MKKTFLSALLAASLLSTSVWAAVEPMESPADPRIKTVVYHERDVVMIKGHYGYSTIIEFAANEVVEIVSIGDSVAWQIVQPQSHPNMIFMKPTEANANTNMTVVTNMRIYSFELSAAKAQSRSDKKLAFRIRFTYQNEEGQGLADIGGTTKSPSGLIRQGKNPDDWNFDYSFSGSKTLRPVRAFDDGKFTYLQFSDLENTPAIFLVDENGNESLINFTRQGKYIVVEKLSRQFTLRDGKETVACVFNDSFPVAAKDDPLAPKVLDGDEDNKTSSTDGDPLSLLGDDVKYDYPHSKK